jgi:hypothetical protein
MEQFHAGLNILVNRGSLKLVNAASTKIVTAFNIAILNRCGAYENIAGVHQRCLIDRS